MHEDWLLLFSDRCRPMTTLRPRRLTRIAMLLVLSAGAMMAGWFLSGVAQQSYGDLKRPTLSGRILKVVDRPNTCGKDNKNTGYLLTVEARPESGSGVVRDTLETCQAPPHGEEIEVVYDPEQQELRTPSTPLTFGLLGMLTLVLFGSGVLFMVFAWLELRRRPRGQEIAADDGEAPDYTWRADRGVAELRIVVGGYGILVLGAAEARAISWGEIKRVVIFDGVVQQGPLRQVTLHVRKGPSLTIPDRSIGDDGTVALQVEAFFKAFHKIRLMLGAQNYRVPTVRVRIWPLVIVIAAALILVGGGVTMLFAALASGVMGDLAGGLIPLAVAAGLWVMAPRLVWQPFDATRFGEDLRHLWEAGAPVENLAEQ